MKHPDEFTINRGSYDLIDCYLRKRYAVHVAFDKATIDKMHISVVVVTFNRKPLLIHALELYDSQKCIENLIVVDNASTDGTDAFLKEWLATPSHFRKIVLRQKKNLGGSFGFNVGLQYAAKLSPDWVWVSDDDVFINEKTLPMLLDFLSSRNDVDTISALCSTVWQQGHINYWHRATIIEKEPGRVTRIPSSSSDYLQPLFEINAYSFVGVLLSKSKLLQAGLPLKKYFIWFDDTEHSLRMAKNGRIFVVPSSYVLHGPFSGGPLTAQDSSWKKYYDLRNYGDLIRRHFSKDCYRRYIKERIIQPLHGSLSNRNTHEAYLYFCVWIDLLFHRLGKRRPFVPQTSRKSRKRTPY